ncbi:hypothetical protein HPB52_010383 [Rhipicephalus sanguineus]|uniref:Uncharacterized protein n=1 Tax=Rhipicephalus sanguineus TaxID=34632 RepID=A0A9D4QEC1_RHISA|nr:hypothetical protein HPB52_010383 [Rhipicephalus sanguineus]
MLSPTFHPNYNALFTDFAAAPISQGRGSNLSYKPCASGQPSDWAQPSSESFVYSRDFECFEGMHNDEMHVTSERLLKQSSMSTLYCDGIDDTSSGGAPAETLVDVRADFGMGDSGGHDAQVSHMLPVDRG